MTEEILNINSDQFPCPSCGAFMVYAPSEGGLKCDYCGHTVDIENNDEEIAEYDLDFDAETSNHTWVKENRIIKCDSCGGESVIPLASLTTACVFCGSAHVVIEMMEEGIPPESVVPFVKTKQEAKAGIKRYISGKFYAPKALKDVTKLDQLRSLYIPYFTYDSNTSTFYTGQRGDHYYVTRTKMVDGKSQTVRERKTRWRHVEGVYDENFDDVLIHASTKVDEALISQMKGFDLSELKPYQSTYLIGHNAERYGISLMDGWYNAKTTINRSIQSGIRNQVGGDEFRLHSHTSNYGSPKYKHILLPIWMTTYKFKEKMYQVYINGQTGRVVGEYPKSILKMFLTVFGVVAVAIIIYYVLTRL